METATLSTYVVADAERSAARFQARTAAKVAFWATALFAAQLYLSPAQWFPDLVGPLSFPPLFCPWLLDRRQF